MCSFSPTRPGIKDVFKVYLASKLGFWDIIVLRKTSKQWKEVIDNTFIERRLYLNGDRAFSVGSDSRTLLGEKTVIWVDNGDEEPMALPGSLATYGETVRVEANKSWIYRVSPKLGKLAFLQDLSLMKNYLKKLPEEIGQLKSLRYLNVYGNRLELLPNSISSLNKLEILHASNNRLKALPKHFANLGQLRHLSLSDNPIKTISKQIKSLVSLRKLWLRGTLVKALPQWVQELRLPDGEAILQQSREEDDGEWKSP